MRDEVETAMRNTGIASLEDASPDLIHTGAIDHLVPDSARHPYARAVRRGSKL